MMQLISAVLLLGSSQSDNVELPSTCVGQEDGYQWLKLLDGDEYPAVYQMCSDGFMVIDVNADPNVESYFTSFDSYHYAIAGPSLEEHINWEGWWVPNTKFTADEDADDYFKYIISPDCSSCALRNNNEDNKMSFLNTDDYGDRTAYTMTAEMFGCVSFTKGLRDCDWDYESYECKYCTVVDSDSDLGYHWIEPNGPEEESYEALYNADSVKFRDLTEGLCGVFPQAAYDTDSIPMTRDDCFDPSVYKPSIGTDGRFCVCVQPNDSFDWKTTYSVTEDEFESAQAAYAETQAEETEEDTGSIDDVYRLYQSDFERGTYRIQKSGTYQLMEDITFDFNAGDMNDPNSGEYQWWPTSDQSDMYPGVGTYRDEYNLGFFAGITVEVDDVVIDLNGFAVAQSEAFYFQQRFFSCIALKSVAFPLNMGPVPLFGAEPKYANNVVIKNGNIGLSSHHGIHGHHNRDVVIENVHVYDFESHGIQMSHFMNLQMKNVEIGPSSTRAFLKGEYAYSRWTLQKLERIYEDEDGYNEAGFPLAFTNREDQALSMKDVIDKLRKLMDIAFKSVMGIEQYDEDDADYIEAKALYINEDGLPYGAVIYGLFLNLFYANVFKVHPTLNYGHEATIENLKIHGLHHKMIEYVRMDNGWDTSYLNMWESAFDAEAMLGTEQLQLGQDIVWSETSYQGSALMDSYIALYVATNNSNWGELGQMFMGQIADWSLGDYTFSDELTDDGNGSPYLGCNNDRMTHVPKGVFGIRMDGVDGVTFDGLEIYDLYEYSDLGSELCGDYWDPTPLSFTGAGHFLQNDPYFYGYSGNRAHGIFSDWSEYTLAGDVSIHDLTCDTGLVRGIGMYTSTELTFSEDATLSFSDFSAGKQLYDTDTDAFDHPYNPAVAKPMHIIWAHWDSTALDTFYSKINGHPALTTATCISGRDGVNASDWTVTVDNTDCAAEEIKLMRSLQARSSGDGHVWWLAASVVVIAALFALWSRCHESAKMLKHTEIQPLLQEN